MMRSLNRHSGLVDGANANRVAAKKEEDDPALKQIQIAIRVELALLEKMILDKMIAGLKKDGEIPCPERFAGRRCDS